ncbi:MAG: hypothetical protein ACK4K6_18135, partial [Pseudarthrobacter sp.]
SYLMSAPGLEEFDLSNVSPRGTPPPSQWHPTSRRAAGCGLGCLAAVVLQGFLIWLVMLLPFSLPEGVDVRLDAPKKVAVGEKFPLTLQVRNGSPKPITVMHVIANHRTAAQLTLEDPQPPPKARPLSVGDGNIWSYEKTVAPGETWSVKYTASARGSGAIKGTLEVQIGFFPKPVPYDIQAEMPAKQP